MTIGTGDRLETSPSPLSSHVPHRRAIRLVFWLLLLSQPFQYVFVARFGEPYPALMMPQFVGSMTDVNGEIRSETAESKIAFVDRSTALLSTEELLSNAPASHRDTIMQFAFGLRPTGDSLRDSSSSITARIKASPLFPGLAARYSARTRTQVDPRTRAWLTKRFRELYPSRTATAVTFVWYQEFYHPKASPDRSRRMIGAYEVQLDAR